MKLRSAYQEYYKLHLYIDNLLHHYPKKYYHSLGVKIRDLNIHILLSLHQQAQQADPDPQEISTLLQQMDTLVFYLNLSGSYAILPQKKLSYILFGIEKCKGLLF